MSTKTLDDLMRELDDNASVKTASERGEIKTASAGGEQTMGLMEMYDEQFGGGSVKTASAAFEQPQVFEKTAEEISLEKLGSAARDTFDVALDDYLFKFAMEDIASREADASVPGVGDPQLPVNRPVDAAAPINTTPVYADQTDRARMAAKEELIGQITAVQNAMTHGGAVDLGAEHPAAQLG